jgi:protocatechuate 3,4-dioxygenase beta subunit
MNRRNLLKLGAGTAATLVGFQALSATSVAQSCKRIMTPRQPEGPFYPAVDQVDTDADLLYVNGSTRAATGEIVIIEGQVKDQHCIPVAGALVEIWQACHTGRYNHTSDPNTAELDHDFQYWGKAVTDKNGKYKFRTIIPGAYPAGTDWVRPPHIHYKVSKRGYLELITQMYFNGNDLLNSKDLILARLSDDLQKEVIVDFKKRADAPHPVGVFDIKIEKLV